MNKKPFLIGKDVALGLGPSRSAALTQIPFALNLPQGKLVCLIGPNGSGKSTLLKTLIGEYQLAGGTINLGPQLIPISQLKINDLPKLVSFLPQEHQYPQEISVEDLLRLSFLAETGYFRPLPNPQDPRLLAMLESLGLSKLRLRPLKQLSTGERQRVFLGRALLQNAAIVLLDEPTNHLDPGGISRFWQTLLKARAASSFNIVVSTHELGFVKSNADWIVALREGNLFYEGSPEAFFEQKLDLKLFDIG